MPHPQSVASFSSEENCSIKLGKFRVLVTQIFSNYTNENIKYAAGFYSFQKANNDEFIEALKENSLRKQFV